MHGSERIALEVPASDQQAAADLSESVRSTVSKDHPVPFKVQARHKILDALPDMPGTKRTLGTECHAFAAHIDCDIIAGHQHDHCSCRAGVKISWNHRDRIARCTNHIGVNIQGRQKNQGGQEKQPYQSQRVVIQKPNLCGRTRLRFRLSIPLPTLPKRKTRIRINKFLMMKPSDNS